MRPVVILDAVVFGVSFGRSRVVIGMAVHADFSAVHGHGAGCSSIAFAGLWRVGSHVLDRKRL